MEIILGILGGSSVITRVLIRYSEESESEKSVVTT